MMLKIRGISTVEDFLTGVNRFGQGLTGCQINLLVRFFVLSCDPICLALLYNMTNESQSEIADIVF